MCPLPAATLSERNIDIKDNEQGHTVDRDLWLDGLEIKLAVRGLLFPNSYTYID